MNNHHLLNVWEEIKLLIDALDKDAFKYAAKGSSIAGRRLRRGTRMLKKRLIELTKFSLLLQKELEAERANGIKYKRKKKEAKEPNE